MPPKNGSKDEKPKEDKSKDNKKTEPKNENNNTSSESSDQSCTAFAKALIYIVPIALYIPWAYRMFKGQPCCHEVPRPPPTAGPVCTSHGKPKWPKHSGRGKGSAQKGEGEACEFEMPKECQEDKAPPEKDDCKKSRQCVDKCLEKCFSRDGNRKGGKRKEKKRRDDCDEDDDN